MTPDELETRATELLCDSLLERGRGDYPFYSEVAMNARLFTLEARNFGVNTARLDRGRRSR